MQDRRAVSVLRALLVWCSLLAWPAQALAQDTAAGEHIMVPWQPGNAARFQAGTPEEGRMTSDQGLDYDAEATADARAQVTEFLRAHAFINDKAGR